MSSLCDYHESNELSGWYSLNPHWWFQRSLCAGVWLDLNARHYWKLSLYWTCCGEPLRLELNFTHPLENVTELIVLGKRMSSVAVDKFGVVGKNVWKWIILLWNKLSIVSFCSNFGTSVPSPETMFQHLTMTLLLLSTRNPAICRVNIVSWLQISDMNCILQTLLDVKGTVFSTTNTTSRWCQRPYSLTQIYAAFIQNMQLLISSNSDKKKLQEFTMLMYFHS